MKQYESPRKLDLSEKSDSNESKSYSQRDSISENSSNIPQESSENETVNVIIFIFI